MSFENGPFPNVVTRIRTFLYWSYPSPSSFTHHIPPTLLLGFSLPSRNHTHWGPVCSPSTTPIPSVYNSLPFWTFPALTSHSIMPTGVWIHGPVHLHAWMSAHSNCRNVPNSGFGVVYGGGGWGVMGIAPPPCCIKCVGPPPAPLKKSGIHNWNQH